MSIINAYTSRLVTNKSFVATNDRNSFMQFKELLMALQERLPGQKQSIQDVAATMRIAVGDVIANAYKDFASFVHAWDFEVRVWKSVEDTNIFTIKMTEKNGCPRSYEFKFANLARH